MLNVVLDANIWLSLLISRKALPIIQAVLEQRLSVFSSPELTNETIDVAQRKKFDRYQLPSAQEIATLHEDFTIVYYPVALFTASPDPDDNYLFDICRESHADYLVTGDGALLAMERVLFPDLHTIEVISLKRFREILAGEHQE
jgi:uncharacterized protein